MTSFDLSLYHSIVVAIIGFLWGGIPTAYLIGLYRGGLDLRSLGSGNLGASNVFQYLGTGPGLIVGVFDCFCKGTVPIWAMQYIGLELAAQCTFALLVLIGHNWSPFLNFTGGRGISTSIGIILGFGLWIEWLILVVFLGFIGRIIIKDTALWTLFALLLLPILCYIFDQSGEIVFTTVVMGVIALLKRVTSNCILPMVGIPRYKVYICRLIWDRDISDKEIWLNQTPNIK